MCNGTCVQGLTRWYANCNLWQQQAVGRDSSVLRCAADCMLECHSCHTLTHHDACVTLLPAYSTGKFIRLLAVDGNSYALHLLPKRDWTNNAQQRCQQDGMALVRLIVLSSTRCQHPHRSDGIVTRTIYTGLGCAVLLKLGSGGGKLTTQP